MHAGVVVVRTVPGKSRKVFVHNAICFKPSLEVEGIRDHLHHDLAFVPRERRADKFFELVQVAPRLSNEKPPDDAEQGVNVLVRVSCRRKMVTVRKNNCTCIRDDKRLEACVLVQVIS